MKYVSTRGVAPALDFGDVLLTGLATDGGLYVPEAYPIVDRERLAALADAPYADVATEIMFPFVEGSIERDDFAAMVTDAYATFQHPDVIPLVDLGDDHHRWPRSSPSRLARLCVRPCSEHRRRPCHSP